MRWILLILRCLSPCRQLKSDSDTGDFGMKYVLSGEGAGEIFQIDEYTGEISSLKVVDREEKAFYILQAQAIDRRTEQPVEPESEFIIKVKDINDHAPVFQNEPYVSSIPEMCQMGRSGYCVFLCYVFFIFFM